MNDGGRSDDDNGHDYGSGDDGIIEGVVNMALGMVMVSMVVTMGMMMERIVVKTMLRTGGCGDDGTMIVVVMGMMIMVVVMKGMVTIVVVIQLTSVISK